MNWTDDMVASLEDHLAQDRNGELMRRLLASLDTMQQRLTIEGRKLHSRDDYRKLEAAGQALQAAQLAMAMVQSGRSTK